MELGSILVVTMIIFSFPKKEEKGKGKRKRKRKKKGEGEGEEEKEKQPYTCSHFEYLLPLPRDFLESMSGLL